MEVDNIVVPLQLTAGEINVILQALGTGAFATVAPIINKIKAQGDPIVMAEVERMRNVPPSPGIADPVGAPPAEDTGNRHARRGKKAKA